MTKQKGHLNPSNHAVTCDPMNPVNRNRGAYTMNSIPSSNSQSNTTHSPSLTGIRQEPTATAARAISRNNFWSRIAVALLAISCAFVGLLPAEAQNVPSGTIELSGGSVAAGIGYTWGNGTLVFDGKKYLVKVDGISIIHVGVSEYTASGTVYNLKKLSDINGVYSAVSAGAAVAGGVSATAMRNSNGVIIQMVATHEGLNLSLGPKGVTVHLEQNNEQSDASGGSDTTGGL
jgi:hypothetical protein